MRLIQTGMSLIELAMALAVLAILLGLAAPSLGAMAESSRFSAASHQLTVSLATARTLAITRGQRVSVCPLALDDACSGSNDWSLGWMVFLDPDRAGQPADGEAIVQVLRRPAGAASPRVGTSPGRRLVRYSTDGMAGGSNLTLSICDANQQRLLGQVVVAISGRARSTREPADSSAACPLRLPPA